MQENEEHTVPGILPVGIVDIKSLSPMSPELSVGDPDEILVMRPISDGALPVKALLPKFSSVTSIISPNCAC